MNGVERITQYSSDRLPQEAPHFIDATKPLPEWPSGGEIVLHNGKSTLVAQFPPSTAVYGVSGSPKTDFFKFILSRHVLSPRSSCGPQEHVRRSLLHLAFPPRQEKLLATLLTRYPPPPAP